MLDTRGRKNVDIFINTMADICIKFKLSANLVTIIALGLGLVASILVAYKLYIAGVIVLWISGFLDSVDGAVARKTKSSSAFGTLMDITFDRIVEIAIILALALNHEKSVFSLMVLAFSIILSMTVFLTVGALSTNNGPKSFRYQAGLIERTEAFILFTLMIVFNSYLTYIAFVFAALIFITALQRFLEAYKILRQDNIL